MLSQKELLKSPNYLLSTYQLEIYRQISAYKKEKNLTQKELAKKLNVSNAYVSQILNGNFNFTLKKLIELGLMIGKVPYLEFINDSEYWRRKKYGTKEYIVESASYSLTIDNKNTENIGLLGSGIISLSGGTLPTKATVYQEVILKGE